MVPTVILILPFRGNQGRLKSRNQNTSETKKIIIPMSFLCLENIFIILLQNG
jgi:hypothetical protein